MESTTKGQLAGQALGMLAGGVPGAGMAMQALQGSGAGPSSAESVSGAVSSRSVVHIAPVGVNFGAIVAPFTSGSPENGGAGLEMMSRFAANMSGGREVPGLTQSVQAEVGFPWKWAIIGMAGVGGLVIFMKMRRG